MPVIDVNKTNGIEGIWVSYKHELNSINPDLVAAMDARGLVFSSWPGIAVRRTASLPLAYVPAIDIFACAETGKTWMPGTRPGITATLNCFFKPPRRG